MAALAGLVWFEVQHERYHYEMYDGSMALNNAGNVRKFVFVFMYAETVHLHE